MTERPKCQAWVHVPGTWSGTCSYRARYKVTTPATNFRREEVQFLCGPHARRYRRYPWSDAKVEELP